jgi:hypothetical protein
MDKPAKADKAAAPPAESPAPPASAAPAKKPK